VPSPRSLTRRSFIGLGLATGLILATVGACPGLSTRERDVLSAALDRLFDPGEHTAPAPREVGAVEAAEAYIAALPARERWLCRGLFRTLEWETVFTRGRRFTRLEPEVQDEVLRGMATSPLYPRRLVFAALKMIGAMGYYQHDATWTHLAYPGPWVAR